MTRGSCTIGIVGCGIIGESWAMAFLAGGHKVAVLDPAIVADTLRGRMAGFLDDAGLLNERLIVVDDPAGLAGCEYVQESIAEDAGRKRALFGELDRALSEDTVIASSTSALCMSDLAAGLEGRARFVVAHPATPPHALPAVEIVPAPFTAPETVTRTEMLLRGIGQSPVRLGREIPGFAMNRLQGALLLEMITMIRDGVISPEGADTLIRDAFGMRWSILGPLEGVHLNAPGGIADYFTRYAAMFEEFCPNGTRFEDILKPDVLDALQAYCVERSPLERTADRRAARDRALMGLRAWREETVS